MRTRIVLMFLAAFVASLLDMFAVASMLPLTQIITAGDQLPGTIRRFLVPVAGTEDRQELLLYLALVMGAAFLVKNVALILIRRWIIREVQAARAIAESTMLERYLSAPYARHRQRSKASMLQLMSNGIAAVFEQVLLGYITIAVDGITVVLITATIVVMSPVASVALVVVFGGSALLIARVLKPYALKFAHTTYLKDLEAYAYLNPAIEGFRESRIFQREEYFSRAYRQNRDEHSRLLMRIRLLGELPKYLLELVLIFGIFGVALILFATHDQITAFGLLAVFAAAAMRIVPSLNRVVYTVNQVRDGGPSLAKLAEEIRQLDQDDVVDTARNEDVVEIPLAPIEASGVCFRYPDSDSDVLTDVTVSIPPGHTVALVGGSGAGKTTFADILTGLYQPTAGTLSVGGVDISTHPASWRRKVAVVSQKVYLWDASIRDLITFGEARDEVDEERLATVIRQARLEELVGQLPDGLDTMVGDSGSRVSGGQAQRIGIARALYSNPDVLILDEATSALDNETEYQITSTIESLRGRMTVIVIAHRLSTVKNADEILFFSAGRLKNRGTMAELRDREPEFARLVELGNLGV